MTSLRTWLHRHRRCKPFDNRRGFCLRAAEWNGRCPRHVRQASDEGELA
jgi:hypothetical protein